MLSTIITETKSLKEMPAYLCSGVLCHCRCRRRCRRCRRLRRCVVAFRVKSAFHANTTHFQIMFHILAVYSAFCTGWFNPPTCLRPVCVLCRMRWASGLYRLTVCSVDRHGNSVPVPSKLIYPIRPKIPANWSSYQCSRDCIDSKNLLPFETVLYPISVVLG